MVAIKNMIIVFSVVFIISVAFVFSNICGVNEIELFDYIENFFKCLLNSNSNSNNFSFSKLFVTDGFGGKKISTRNLDLVIERIYPKENIEFITEHIDVSKNMADRVEKLENLKKLKKGKVIKTRNYSIEYTTLKNIRRRKLVQNFCIQNYSIQELSDYYLNRFITPIVEGGFDLNGINLIKRQKFYYPDLTPFNSFPNVFFSDNKSLVKRYYEGPDFLGFFNIYGILNPVLWFSVIWGTIPIIPSSLVGGIFITISSYLNFGYDYVQIFSGLSNQSGFITFYKTLNSVFHLETGVEDYLVNFHTPIPEKPRPIQYLTRAFWWLPKILDAVPVVLNESEKFDPYFYDENKNFRFYFREFDSFLFKTAHEYFPFSKFQLFDQVRIKNSYVMTYERGGPASFGRDLVKHLNVKKRFIDIPYPFIEEPLNHLYDIYSVKGNWYDGLDVSSEFDYLGEVDGDIPQCTTYYDFWHFIEKNSYDLCRMYSVAGRGRSKARILTSNDFCSLFKSSKITYREMIKIDARFSRQLKIYGRRMLER